MAYQAELLEARFREHARDEGREVQHAHLADVPGPHARVGVVQERVLGLEAAAVVAEPDVVAALAEEEGEAVVVVAAVCAGALQQAVDHQDGVLSLTFSRAAGAALRRDVGEVFVGKEFGRAIGALGGGAGHVLFWVVDVPERDDEAVFRLDLEFFDVEADSARVVGGVADQRVLAAFRGLELIGAGAFFVEFAGLDGASPPPPAPLPRLLFVFPLFSPALFFLVKWAAGIGVSEGEAEEDVSEHEGDAGEGRT